MFWTELNLTTLSQLTGKFILPIVHSPEITRKLSMVYIINTKDRSASFGVLLDRDRVAFVEKKWTPNHKMLALVHCWDEEVRKVFENRIPLGTRIPEKDRFYLAEGIVEVKVSSIAKEQCPLFICPFQVNMWHIDV